MTVKERFLRIFSTILAENLLKNLSSSSITDKIKVQQQHIQCLSLGLFFGKRMSVTLNGWRLSGRPWVFPRKSDIRSDCIIFNATSCCWNCAKVGFSLQPALLRCLAKCSSSGSCDNFSLNKNLTPSCCKISFPNSINELTKIERKRHDFTRHQGSSKPWM